MIDIRFRSVNQQSGIPQQSGAALFIGLIILLILTILGLAAANVSILQERMAGNVAQSNEAFQVADSTLREIESRIYNNICLGGGSGGIGVIPSWPGGLDPNDCTLAGLNPDTSTWAIAPGVAQPGGNGWGRFFVVELPGQPRCHAANSALDGGGGGVIDRSYVVMASGRSASGQAESIVQSLVTCVQ